MPSSKASKWAELVNGGGARSGRPPSRDAVGPRVVAWVARAAAPAFARAGAPCRAALWAFRSLWCLAAIATLVAPMAAAALACLGCRRCAPRLVAAVDAGLGSKSRVGNRLASWAVDIALAGDAALGASARRLPAAFECVSGEWILLGVEKACSQWWGGALGDPPPIPEPGRRRFALCNAFDSMLAADLSSLDWSSVDPGPDGLGRIRALGASRLGERAAALWAGSPFGLAGMLRFVCSPKSAPADWIQGILLEKCGSLLPQELHWLAWTRALREAWVLGGSSGPAAAPGPGGRL